MAGTCGRCGRRVAEDLAVLPRLRALVCPACFREATGHYPLPAANRVAALAVREGQFLTQRPASLGRRRLPHLGIQWQPPGLREPMSPWEYRQWRQRMVERFLRAFAGGKGLAAAIAVPIALEDDDEDDEAAP